MVICAVFFGCRASGEKNGIIYRERLKLVFNLLSCMKVGIFVHTLHTMN